MTRSERQDERRKQREAEQEQRRKHTVKYVEVCDAYQSKPQYQGEYNEDGERPILNHPHAWFILVTLGDGTRWYSRDDSPFSTFPFFDKDDLRNKLEQGYRKDGDEWLPLFQAGPRHVTNLEGLIARARMDERAEAIRTARVLDPETRLWGRWAYSERGSDAWAAEMRDVEMRERQDPSNW
tara:strand:- start:259 stop:801 length:543 start_codon:yes stop_codon:yes gene_type:complete